MPTTHARLAERPYLREQPLADARRAHDVVAEEVEPELVDGRLLVLRHEGAVLRETGRASEHERERGGEREGGVDEHPCTRTRGCLVSSAHGPPPALSVTRREVTQASE